MNKIGLVFKGMAMGVAEVIPGVSGGTIAFISGIYEQLINSIKAIGPIALNGFKSEGLAGLWKAINGDFLVWVILGMGFGVVSGIFGVTYLIDNYPEPLWAFFFGLILASAIYIGTEVNKWDFKKISSFIIGVFIAFGITILSPAEGSLHPAYVFISGVIAISALMLPGISGSFILLIMGMYTLIVPLAKDTIKSMDPGGLLILGIFGVGCLTGMVIFSRILSWLFVKYKDITLALLTGFLIGALNKVWPWRNLSSALDKETKAIFIFENPQQWKGIDLESIKVISESNVLPSEYWGEDPMTLISIVTFILGAAIVYVMSKSTSNQ